jgi:hypothetical protein
MKYLFIVVLSVLFVACSNPQSPAAVDYTIWYEVCGFTTIELRGEFYNPETDSIVILADTCYRWQSPFYAAVSGDSLYLNATNFNGGNIQAKIIVNGRVLAVSDTSGTVSVSYKLW